MCTKRDTPAARAAASIAPVPSTWTAANVCGPCSTMMPTRWTIASAPRASRSRAVRSPRCPGRGSTPCWGRKRVRPGSRVRARTWCPRRTSVAAMCRPTNPVPPVSATSMECRPLERQGRAAGSAAGSGRRAAALVQEHQRPASPHDGRERVVDRRVNYRPGEVRKALDGLLRGQLLLVGARGAEGIVDLRGPEDPGGHGYLLAAQPVRVAGAVPALVVSRRSEEHTSELQSQFHLVCRLLLEKKKKKRKRTIE